jgi:hypothetical protein
MHEISQETASFAARCNILTYTTPTQLPNCAQTATLTYIFVCWHYFLKILVNLLLGPKIGLPHAPCNTSFYLHLLKLPKLPVHLRPHMRCTLLSELGARRENDEQGGAYGAR